MNARAWILPLAVLSIASLSPHGARADVVDPPPENCPAGTNPGSSHSGPICSPRPACMSDVMCGGGEACEEVRLCVVQRPCGGLLPPDAGPCFIDHAVGFCGADGSCGEGTCVIRDVCAAPGSTSGGGCGCSVTRGPSAIAIAAAFALLSLVLGRRMRYLARR